MTFRPLATTRDAVRTLRPGSFALVMATGIISIDLRQRLPLASTALLWLAAASYAVLVGLHLWRLLAYRAELLSDLSDPGGSFAFFTFVAGTNVLGTRLITEGQLVAAAVLLAVGGVAWLGLGYLVPLMALLRGGGGRQVLAAANGTWFIWVVGTQSVAVLAASLAPATGPAPRWLVLLATVCWSVGAALYVGVAIFVAARLILHPPTPAQLIPPYWVAMGATAITAVAGGRIAEITDAPMVVAAGSMITGASIAFWAFGTWLIPPLLAAGWWRHVTRRVPLRYEPGWWSVVFPLGMYAAAAHELGLAGNLPLLTATGSAETWFAVTAWCITFAGMLVHLARRYTGRSTGWRRGQG